MSKKKLTLSQLKVNSFVTGKDLRGGIVETEWCTSTKGGNCTYTDCTITGLFC